MRASPEAARRALVTHVGLGNRVRGSVAETVQRLGAVQMDPMRVVAQAHLLTLRLRRGPTTEMALSRDLSSGRLIEARLKERCLLAGEDLPAAAAEFHRIRAMNLLSEHGVVEVAEGLLRILEEGARMSRDLVTDRRVASFWDNNPTMKATTMALDILSEEGRVIITGRRRGERRYDLPDRLFPAWGRILADPSVSRRHAARHYGRTMGVFSPSDPYFAWIRSVRKEAAARRAVEDEFLASGEWVAFEIDGVSRRYLATRTFAELAQDPPELRGVRLLAPLDNLLWDRRRLKDLFDFTYTWEAYTPPTKRRVGPYGMPLLLDGRLVGEVDAQRDQEGLLRWRIVERTAIRASERGRIERAVRTLARDIGARPRPVDA